MQQMKEDFEPFYKTLRLARNADASEMRASYKELAQKWHPDRQRDPVMPREASEAIFKEITRAYSVLNNYRKAHHYLPYQLEFGVMPRPAGAHTQSENSDKTESEWRRYAMAAGLAIVVAGLGSTVWKSFDSPNGSVEHDSVAALAGESLPTIELGDSQERVMEILGRPSFLSRSRWQYDMSQIYFKNGKVSGWHNSRQSPIPVRESELGTED